MLHTMVATLIIVLGCSVLGTAMAGSPLMPALYSTRNFAVLAGAGVTRTSEVSVYGDVGSYATPVAGVTFNHLAGVTHPDADPICAQAQFDNTLVYTDLNSRSCDADMSDTDLGGLTLYPGVYCFGAAAGIAGDTELVLDGNGEASPVWIFQIGTALNVGKNVIVRMQNADTDCNVFWAVGSSAVIADHVAFSGSIYADQSINLQEYVVVTGSLLASIASVTFTGSATVGSQSCVTDTLATSSSSSSSSSFSSSSSSSSSPQDSEASSVSSSSEPSASSSEGSSSEGSSSLSSSSSSSESSSPASSSSSAAVSSSSSESAPASSSSQSSLSSSSSSPSSSSSSAPGSSSSPSSSSSSSSSSLSICPPKVANGPIIGSDSPDCIEIDETTVTVAVTSNRDRRHRRIRRAAGVLQSN